MPSVNAAQVTTIDLCTKTRPFTSQDITRLNVTKIMPKAITKK